MIIGFLFPATKENVRTLDAFTLLKVQDYLILEMAKHGRNNTPFLATETVEQYQIVREEILERLFRLEELDK